MAIKTLVAFLCGIVFSFGLILGGMINPATVLAFLNLAGHWNPSLLFVLGGAVSLFASANPDGLEWAMEHVAGTTELTANDGVHNAFAGIQQATAFLPDYGFKSSGADGSAAGTSFSGLLGAGVTLLLAGGTGYLIYAVKNKKKKAAAGLKS